MKFAFIPQTHDVTTIANSLLAWRAAGSSLSMCFSVNDHERPVETGRVMMQGFDLLTETFMNKHPMNLIQGTPYLFMLDQYVSAELVQDDETKAITLIISVDHALSGPIFTIEVTDVTPFQEFSSGNFLDAYITYLKEQGVEETTADQTVLAIVNTADYIANYHRDRIIEEEFQNVISECPVTCHNSALHYLVRTGKIDAELFTKYAGLIFRKSSRFVFEDGVNGHVLVTIDTNGVKHHYPLSDMVLKYLQKYMGLMLTDKEQGIRS